MSRRVAITGAAGQLGRQLARAFSAAGDVVLPLRRPDFDLTREADLRRLTRWEPNVVVNAAAWTDVDSCAQDPERALRINGRAAGAVAEAASRARALSVQISTNEVFSGSLDRAYVEEDEPDPINPYGASKLVGERLVARANQMYLVVRTAWLFSGEGRNFPTRIRAAANSAVLTGSVLRVVADELGNPTPADLLANAIAKLVAEHLAGRVENGVWHLVGEPPTSRFDWAAYLIRDRGVKLERISLVDYPRPSRVPPRAVLSVQKAADHGIAVGDWRGVDLPRMTATP